MTEPTGMRSEGAAVHWGTVAVVTALIVPFIAAGVAYGELHAEVSDIAVLTRAYAEQQTQMETALTSLSISVARLSENVQTLTREVGSIENARTYPQHQK